MTVAAYAEQWLLRVAIRRRPSTVRVYTSTARLLTARLGTRRLVDIRRADVIALGDALTKAGHAANYVRSAIRVLSAIFASAIEDELVTVNPTLGVPRHYVRGVRMGAPIPRDDLARILAHLVDEGSDLSDLLTFLVQTGTRLGEALALRWQLVDLVGQRAQIERTWLDREAGPCKGGEARSIHLFPETVALLARLPRVNEWCFPGPSGRPRHRCQVQRGFARTMRDLRLTHRAYVPHALRHSFATLAIEAGYRLEWVQQQLGHRSIEITRRLYARFARVPTPAGLDSWGVLVRHEILRPLPVPKRIRDRA